MGKLNIAHHKSYHPYRLDNIERVRRDEAAAKRKQTDDADRALVADAESRLSTLRTRAGITPPRTPPKDTNADLVDSTATTVPGSAMTLSDGHINLFADLEEHAAALAARASKSKPAMSDSDHGVPLAPTKQDLNPWYTAGRDVNKDDKTAEARRQRDLARQHKADPLSLVPLHLKRPSRAIPPVQPNQSQQSSHPPPSSSSREGRLARESTERARAQALLRRKQRERECAESTTATPSTVHGSNNGPGYVDVFNRREVEDAHRERDRSWRQRRWEDSGDDRHRWRH